MTDNDSVPDLTMRLLQDIRGELRKLNTRMESVEAELRGNGIHLAAVEKATVQGFVRLETRFESLRDFAGEHYRD
jgi:hypothetical protein